MENLTRLNTRVDALILALRTTQDETTQLRKDLEDSRTAGMEKDTQIRSLELANEDKDLHILVQEETISKKDAQLEELITRIEQVLSELPQPTAVEQAPIDSNI